MANVHEFSESWKRRIERDLASFADPGTTVEVTGSGRSFRAAWSLRGTNREALFSVSLEGGVSVRTDGRPQAYGAFVSGPHLADLKSVARMILQTSKQELFVSTKARLDDPEGATPEHQPGSAVELLTTQLHKDIDTATRVVLVTGDAGAGKTRVLKELVRRQADDYVRGQTTKLLLYVNAQGRALARLNEALATELQDLKVGLTYHSIAVLARLGILIPVIDGFDELLGVSGYDDAFSSLAGFLDQLQGEGQLLVSARSLYYEEEFLTRAGNAVGNVGQAWELVPIRVSAWEADEREQYLRQWTSAEGLSDNETTELHRRVQELFTGRHRNLESKPLFFIKTVELLQRNPDFSGGDDLLRSLVDDYLTRERNDKLLDRQSRPILTGEQLERLMRELAEEMWNQETRELSSRSVREVAEYVLEDEALPDDQKRIVMERMPTLAFLGRLDVPTEHAGISFEHELFFFYFLAGTIASQWCSESWDMRIILSRSALPEDVAVRAAKEPSMLGEADVRERLQELMDRLARAGETEWRRVTQVRENAGLLVMALLREYAALHGEVEGCTIQSVVFPGSHLHDVTLRNCSLSDVTIQRTDLTSTRFIDCRARNVLLREAHLEPTETRLELQGLKAEEVVGIRIRNGNSTEMNYAPSVVFKVLRECGLVECGAGFPGARTSPEPRVSPKYVDLLERLIRAYRRANPICVSDQNLTRIFDAPEWGTLEHLLVEHDLVNRETRPTSGRSTEFLRRQFRTEQLMSGLGEHSGPDARIRSFWQALEAESRNAV